MIFIDSSVWIEYFKGNKKDIKSEIYNLLDSNQVALAAPVRIEVLSGTSKKDFQTLNLIFSALPIFYPSRQSWQRIDHCLEIAKHNGLTFGFADLLIAVIVNENKGKLWSFDKDFKPMAKLNFLELYN